MTKYDFFSITKTSPFARKSVSIGLDLQFGTVSRFNLDTTDGKNLILNDPSLGMWNGTCYPVLTHIRKKTGLRYHHIDSKGNQIAAIASNADVNENIILSFHCGAGDHIIVMEENAAKVVGLYWCLDDGLLVEDPLTSTESVNTVVRLITNVKAQADINATGHYWATPDMLMGGKSPLNRAPTTPVRNDIIDFFDKITGYPEITDDDSDEELQVGFKDFIMNCHAVSIEDAKDLLETKRSWMSTEWFTISENQRIRSSTDHFLGWEELISKEKETIFLSVRVSEENCRWESPSFILVVDVHFDLLQPRLIPVVHRGLNLYLRTSRSVRRTYHDAIPKTEYVRLDDQTVRRYLIDQIHGFTTLGMPTKIKEVVAPMMKDIETQFKELLDIKVEPTELMFLHRKFEEES